jgi:hypothetical protein
MVQWEYLHIRLLPLEVEPALQLHGLNGWELASLVVARYKTGTTGFHQIQEADEFIVVLKRIKDYASYIP